MKLLLIATRNLWRNKLRTMLTMLDGAMAILTFIALHTVLSS